MSSKLFELYNDYQDEDGFLYIKDGSKMTQSTSQGIFWLADLGSEERM